MKRRQKLIAQIVLLYLYSIHCDKHRVTGITQQGGHQEYLIVDETALVDLPTDSKLSDAEMAPLLCAGNTVVSVTPFSAESLKHCTHLAECMS